jgi:alginate O-acetyltransferase complex protein AlgI
MLFNSYTFLFAFLPLVVAGWWTLRERRLRLAFLTAASWVFYGWWDWRYLSLLVATTALSYAVALVVDGADGPRLRRSVLAAAIAIHVALLGYFKYAGFFVDSLQGAASALGVQADLPAVDVLLPVGISFYTFIAIAYEIDVFRRAVAPTRNPLEHTTFVGMFPHVIAGPIVRIGDVAEQLRGPASRLTADDAMKGLFFIGCGLAKKLLIADRLGPTVDRLFADPGQLGLLGGWAAAVGYSLQLYFDFSGYSDIAVGCAWLLGFRYPQNFDSPYKASSVTDFWQRWHMTLSRWLRDYLFFSLARRYAVGVSRRAGRRERVGTYWSLFLTMLVAGLWHGAAWTFVAWGAMHGAALAAERAHHDRRRLARRRAAPPTAARTAARRTLTFAFVVAAFAVFRSPSLTAAGTVLAAMAGAHGLGSVAVVGARFAALLGALLVFVNVAPNTWQVGLAPRLRYALALGVVSALAIMSLAQVNTFIYFRF